MKAFEFIFFSDPLLYLISKCIDFLQPFNINLLMTMRFVEDRQSHEIERQKIFETLKLHNQENVKCFDAIQILVIVLLKERKL